MLTTYVTKPIEQWLPKTKHDIGSTSVKENAHKTFVRPITDKSSPVCIKPEFTD